MAECVEKGTMVDVTGESRIETHSKILMTGLNALRLADKLLDVTLLVEGVRMKAHRVVLAACSDYFAAMFTDPMKEASQSEIQLSGVTARGMQILIDYAYTSKLDIDRDCVQDILSAATYVQLDGVVESCASFLEGQLDIENCVDLAVVAEMYSLRRLRNKTYRFICSRLSEFAKTPEMNNLKFEQLEFILSCDYPVDCSEAKVINIVAEYCVQKKVTLEVAKRLFTRIRFNQIKQIDLRVWPRFDHVDVAVHSPYYNVMRAVGFQQKKSTKKKGAYQDPNDILLSDVLTNARGMELAVVKIGGFLMNGLHNLLSFALPNERKWHHLTAIPHIEQCNYGIAVLNNDLFVVGGSYDVCLKEYIHGFGFRYNATKNKWTTIAQIQSDRCRFSLNAVGNHLYAVGGIVESIDDSYMMPSHSHARRVSNCERYDVKHDMWEFITPLMETRSQHAGVGLGRYLYISGGIERHSLVLSSFWRYDTYQDRWEEKCPMRKPRADHVLLAIEDKIYACGGWYEDSMSEMRVLAESIDVYDIYTDTWHFETKNPVPTFHSGITSVKNKIYFVGGLLSDETTNCSPNVQTYDISTRQWAPHTEWDSAKPTWECTCASFYVPRCREGI